MTGSESELQIPPRAVKNELTGADELVTSYEARGQSPSQDLVDKRNRLLGMDSFFNPVGQDLPKDVRGLIQALEGYDAAQGYADGMNTEVSSFVANLKGERQFA